MRTWGVGSTHRGLAGSWHRPSACGKRPFTPHPIALHTVSLDNPAFFAWPHVHVCGQRSEDPHCCCIPALRRIGPRCKRYLQVPKARLTMEPVVEDGAQDTSCLTSGMDAFICTDPLCLYASPRDALEGGEGVVLLPVPGASIADSLACPLSLTLTKQSEDQ